MRIRVLVVDDSAFMRKVIADLLDQDPDIAVVDTRGTGERPWRRWRSFRPMSSPSTWRCR
ncbi:hypothetical protein [Calditerricola satsumensis]|uniref:hypothetical protein n=1 Tax=Calditerricola satsumensis TaxID=373054 RepID=UPI003570A0E8